MALDILIVDDERDICELVAGVMEDEGYEARTASDSDAALEAIRQRRPSLALIDVDFFKADVHGGYFVSERAKNWLEQHCLGAFQFALIPPSK